MSHPPATPPRWRTPTLLLLLFALPIFGSIYRLFTLAFAQVTGLVDPTIAHIASNPLPMALHAAGGAIFCTLGAFQFRSQPTPAARKWHRYAGRVTAVAGFTFALSGLWCLWAYPAQSDSAAAVLPIRAIACIAIAATLTLGIKSAMRRNIKAHRTWMIRTVAITAGPVTQAYMLLIAEVFWGGASQFVQGLLILLSWLVSISIGEWIILRPATHLSEMFKTPHRTTAK